MRKWGKQEVVSEVQIPSEVFISRLMQHFDKRKDVINSRLEDFSNTDKSNRKVVFEELAFCLLTPQSKARSAGKAIEKLKENNLLFNGSAEEITPNLAGVRFNATKAKRIVEAREKFDKFKFDFSDVFKLRDEVVSNFKGLGYKEASHFLRNIGYGENLAILDRHVLRNLVKMGIIDEVPKSISTKSYFEIESRMQKLCLELGISVAQLDLLLWSEETGEVFK